MKVVEWRSRLSEVDRDALPSFLLHCTFRRHLDSVLNNGLLAGGDRGEAHRLQVQRGWLPRRR